MLRSALRASSALAQPSHPPRQLLPLLQRLSALAGAQHSAAASSTAPSSNPSSSSPDWHTTGKYAPAPPGFVAPRKLHRDVIIIGGGHNGLVAAAYLARAGLDVLVLERRHLLGGAAVTEEVVPGFKFSRASYLAGLLRPQIIKDLDMERHGFKYLVRDPSSFTPTLDGLGGGGGGRGLLLGSDAAATAASISQFSKRDAERFVQYEDFLGRAREVVKPMLDAPLPAPLEGAWRSRLRSMRTAARLGAAAARRRDVLVPLYELFTAPAAQILDRWFEGDVLKATLATDSVIGAMTSPRNAGSGYVLLHHVMGEAAGREGVWAYVQGGMGALSSAVAAAAREAGAELATGAEVRELLLQPGAASGSAKDGGGRRVKGVRLAGGEVVTAGTVVAGCTPWHLYTELLPEAEAAAALPAAFRRHVAAVDYSCGAFKINCAVDALPRILWDGMGPAGAAGPEHRGTIHFETHMDDIHEAFLQAAAGYPAEKPVVEMTIPSVLDTTLAPSGQHVVQLFVQFAPFDLDPSVGTWADAEVKRRFVERVFSVVEKRCPGFRKSVIGYDALSPLDLQTIFGLHRGNIFHGALALHQLGLARPAPEASYAHRTPVEGLYLGGAGAHPGGGVMGAAGRNAATVILDDLGR